MKHIITIGRELGSGGRTVGKRIAAMLGIPYYDRELIDEAAEKSGLAPEFIENNEQTVSGGYLYKLGMGMSYGYRSPVLSLPGQIYIAQAKVIKQFADQGPCVIVGRCADFVLKNYENVFKVFLYADLEHRIQRAVTHYGMDEKTVKKEILKSDKARARHYNLFTDRTWGDRKNYDLMLNSGAIGIEKCAGIICDILERYKEE